MMNETMTECCGHNGMPNFEKMKAFMEKCGKTQFTEDEFTMMRQFCGQTGKPDAEKMRKILERCGCR